jgi:hypothetical protein
LFQTSVSGCLYSLGRCREGGQRAQSLHTQHSLNRVLVPVFLESSPVLFLSQQYPCTAWLTSLFWLGLQSLWDEDWEINRGALGEDLEGAYLHVCHTHPSDIPSSCEPDTDLIWLWPPAPLTISHGLSLWRIIVGSNSI